MGDKLSHILNSKIQFNGTILYFHLDRPDFVEISKPFQKIPVQEARSYLELCSSCIDEIYIETKQCFNGAMKLQLSEWWTELVRDRITTFLQGYNYDFNAVQFNVLKPKEECTSAIVANIELLDKMHDPSFYLRDVMKNLVAPLKEEIYPKLLNFRDKLRMILITQSFGSQKKMETFRIDIFKKEYSLAIDNGIVNDELKSDLNVIVNDISFINSMIKLETECTEDLTKLYELSEIKPVSGLVMHYLRHMEKELEETLLKYSNMVSPTRGRRRVRRATFQSGNKNPLKQGDRGSSLEVIDTKTIDLNYTPLELSTLSAWEIEQLQKLQPVPLFKTFSKEEQIQTSKSIKRSFNDLNEIEEDEDYSFIEFSEDVSVESIENEDIIFT